MEIRLLDKKKIGKSIFKIAEARFNTKVLSVRYLGGGSYGMAYLINMKDYPYKVVMKAYKVKGMHETEKMQIDILSNHSRIRFPKIFFTMNEDSKYPFDLLCMEYIEGVCAFNPLFVFKSKNKRSNFSDKVVVNSIALHEVTNDKYGFLNNVIYNTWQDFYYDYAKTVIDGAKALVSSGKLHKKYLDVMEKAFDKFDIVFQDSIDKAVLIHGDLNVCNIMVDKKTLEPLAIIDPFNSMWGDREYDLFQFKNFMNRTFRLYDNYKTKYSVSKYCDLKVSFYALFNEILCYINSGYTVKILLYIQRKSLIKQMKRFNIY